jgi:hypothetical protein
MIRRKSGRHYIKKVEAAVKRIEAIENLALTRPVTLVTMTCRWWQDMIQSQAFP